MRPDRKIGLLCVSKGFGGLEMNTLKLAKWLRELGWEVSVMVAGNSETAKLAKDFCDKVYTMPLKNSFLGSERLGCMQRWLKDFPARIVFITHNKDIAVAASCKRRYDGSIRLVYQQHMQVGVNKKDLIHNRRYRMLDMWVAPLQYLKEETVQRTAVPASKIAVIPLGLEAERFVQNDIPQHAARKQLSLPPGKKIFGVLGRIDPKKGQDFLIAATRKLRDDYHKDYHLLIMGAVTPHEGNAHLDALYKMVKDHGLEDRVHFRESTAQVEIFYNAIDVFAMPSYGETYGMVTLEAMAAGKPVIGANRDGTKEILQGGKLGYVYELGDTDGFCRQLAALMEHEHVGQLVNAARNEVSQHYTKEIMMQRLDAALKKLL